MNMSDFQERCQNWVIACMGYPMLVNVVQRNQRFYEEATELVQSTGMSREECHELVDYTFDRPVGDKFQEAGGVMNTFALLCTANAIDMGFAAITEMDRVEQPEVMEKIRAKQAGKPEFSALPGNDKKFEPVTVMLSRTTPISFVKIEEDKGELLLTVMDKYIFSNASVELNKEQVKQLRDNLSLWLQTH